VTRHSATLVADRRIEGVELAGDPDRRPLVLLHEGLGSVGLWHGFPEALQAAIGRRVLAFSRFGHGRSEPPPRPRTPAFFHEEAFDVLPVLLAEHDAGAPVLIGHSDGGSIALIHAGAAPRPTAGVVTLAAHVLVEDLSVSSIAAAKRAFETTDMRQKLSRHHADVDSVFWSWNRIWLSPEFRGWNIEEYLPTIACPVLAIQGEDDEYGTMEQMRRIAAKAPDVELVMLPDCGHSAHKDQPDAVIEAIARFVDRVAG